MASVVTLSHGDAQLRRPPWLRGPSALRNPAEMAGILTDENEMWRNTEQTATIAIGNVVARFVRVIPPLALRADKRRAKLLPRASGAPQAAATASFGAQDRLIEPAVAYVAVLVGILLGFVLP